MTRLNVGSATRATLADLRHRGMDVIAAAALLTVGHGAHDLCRDEGLGLAALKGLESTLWHPADCPFCLDGHTPTDLASA